jgi:hypothetical protein
MLAVFATAFGTPVGLVDQVCAAVEIGGIRCRPAIHPIRRMYGGHAVVGSGDDDGRDGSTSEVMRHDHGIR